MCLFSHCTKLLSGVRLFATLCTVAHQAPLSVGFSRQEYWSGLPCSPPGDLPNPGTEPASLTSPALAGRFLPLAPPGKPVLIPAPSILPSGLDGGLRHRASGLRRWTGVCRIRLWCRHRTGIWALDLWPAVLDGACSNAYPVCRARLLVRTLDPLVCRPGPGSEAPASRTPVRIHIRGPIHPTSSGHAPAGSRLLEVGGR